MEAALRRSGHILGRNMRKFLLPMIATAIATSLDEFVDSIIVSGLLGPEAMALVNVGAPIMFFFAATYMLFGVGGATLYAFNIGRRDQEKAGRIFSVSLFSGLVVSLLMLIFGSIFLSPLSFLLCGDAEVAAQVSGYIRLLLISAPFIIGIQTVLAFLPAAGKPAVTSTLNIVANAINLVGDFLFITCFPQLGIQSAALATLFGYVVCLIVLVVLLVKKKIPLCMKKPRIADFRLIGDVSGQGASNALVQIGYCVKYMFFNNIAITIGGAIALQSYSVCIQIFSIMSIGLAGVVETVAPFLATLRGQRDYNGVHFVLRSGLLYDLGIAAVVTVVFELFPQLMFWMFSVSDPQVMLLAETGIRVFLISFMIRSLYVIYMAYARIIGYKLYSVLISVLDGFGLLIPVTLLLTNVVEGDTAAKMNGIWWAFPITSVLLLLGVIVCNLIIAARSKGKFRGVLLLESDDEDVSVYDVTIRENDETIAFVSEDLNRFCVEHGVTPSVAVRVGLLAEEMALYIRRHRKKGEQIDILTRITARDISLEFRSEGTPFDPLAATEVDSAENLAILRKLPNQSNYDYILGMNSTRFIIDPAAAVD